MKVDILGVKVDNLTFAQVLEKIERWLAAGGTDHTTRYIVTPYAESVVQAQTDEEFHHIINQADLAVPDGVGLLMAAKFLELARQLPTTSYQLRALRLLGEGLRVGLSAIFDRGYLDVIREEVKGTDLMLSLCEKAQARGWRVFLLGGWDGVAEKVANKLKQQWSNLTIDSMVGSKDVDRETPSEWEEVKSRLSQFKPDLLFVAYGPVKQERWVRRHLPELSTKVAVGVAGAFDMLAGRKPRAPRWLRQLGLEWLWRLLLEPARLPRIWRAVVVFPWLVFRKGGGGDVQDLRL
jgi:N-acetylglucosaminyldiphosphoundecaprenol N-acetyl-beta-D-mannosaminyltransferase